MSGPHESPPTTLTDFDPLCACEVSTVTENADDPLHPPGSMTLQSDVLGGDPAGSDSKSSQSGSPLHPWTVASPWPPSLTAPDDVDVVPLPVPLFVDDDPVGELCEPSLAVLPPSPPFPAVLVLLCVEPPSEGVVDAQAWATTTTSETAEK
jgi:hypothetical protein